MDPKENAWATLVNALIDYQEFEPDTDQIFFELGKEVNGE